MIIPPKLTPRERQILPMLANGETRSEIARHTGVSEETVKVHTKNIVSKFDAVNVRDGITRFWSFLETYTDQGFGFQFYLKFLDVDIQIQNKGKLAIVKRRFDVVAVGDRVEEFLEIAWTTGDIRNPRMNGVEVQARKSSIGREHYVTKFEPPLKDGDETSVLFECEFVDNFCDPENYFRLVISHPTVKFRYKISFDEGEHPSKIWAEKSMGVASLKLSPKVFTFQNGVAELLISEPELNDEYYIYWTVDT